MIETDEIKLDDDEFICKECGEIKHTSERCGNCCDIVWNVCTECCSCGGRENYESKSYYEIICEMHGHIIKNGRLV